MIFVSFRLVEKNRDAQSREQKPLADVCNSHGHRRFFIKRASGSSIGQSLSAFSASSLKNVSAVGSSHSFSEAMLLLSLTLFGLVSSEHYLHLLQTLSEACCFTATFTLLHNDGLYYTRKEGTLSRVFENFSSFFCRKNKKEARRRGFPPCHGVIYPDNGTPRWRRKRRPR